jgi:hypothetical protein
MTLLVFSTIKLGYLVSQRPFDNIVSQFLGFFNEYMVSAYLIVMLGITDTNTNKELKEIVSLLFITIVLTHSFVNIMCFFLVAVSSIILACRKRQRMMRFLKYYGFASYEDYLKHKNAGEAYKDDKISELQAT